MTQEEIYEKILDCQDILDKLQSKQKLEVINGIVDRYNRYIGSGEIIDINSLKNAVLENKLKNTTLEILIIEKILGLKLPTDYQGIYENIPYTIEEQINYVTKLSNSYELAYNCYNLLIEIETLSESELEIDYEEFKKGEYARLIQCFNNIFKNNYSNSTYNVEYSVEIITSYLKNLTLEQKQSLYYESLSLCYTRNVFDYLDLRILCNQINKGNLLNDQKVSAAYQLYNQLLINKLLSKIICEKTLSEVYETISQIHNSKSVKQLIIKK